MENKDVVNLNATCPGAVVALSLMYIRSNNEMVAKRLNLPELAFEYEEIRPDLLLYLALGKCLILWDSVKPSDTWISNQIPQVVKVALQPLLKGNNIPFLENTDFDSRNNDRSQNARSTCQKSGLSSSSALMAYLSIITGLGLGLGLIYAGTDDHYANQLSVKILRYLKSLRDAKVPVMAERGLVEGKLLRAHVDMCLSVSALSCSCICAGSGQLDLLRILRQLRGKVEDVPHGVHMAYNMSIGFLFLGGGRAALRRDDVAIGCLLLSLLPRFPSRPADNQYYLQALRHLYVIAVEYRLLRVEDVDTGEQLSVQLQIELFNGEKRDAVSPCLLPELSSVRGISFVGQVTSESSSSSATVEGRTLNKSIDQSNLSKRSYFPSTLPINPTIAMNRLELPPFLLKAIPENSVDITPYTYEESKSCECQSSCKELSETLLRELQYEALINS